MSKLIVCTHRLVQKSASCPCRPQVARAYMMAQDAFTMALAFLRRAKERPSLSVRAVPIASETPKGLPNFHESYTVQVSTINLSVCEASTGRPSGCTRRWITSVTNGDYGDRHDPRVGSVSEAGHCAHGLEACTTAHDFNRHNIAICKLAPNLVKINGRRSAWLRAFIRNSELHT